jgi:hypothetical protein
MGYTAIVLEEKEQNKLRQRVKANTDFSDWEIKCHHCTLHMGLPTVEEDAVYDNSFILVVDAIGISDKAVAFRVKNIVHPRGVEIRSSNDIPHITLLVNSKDGGKAVDSNAIVNWFPINDDEDECMRYMGRLKFIE